MDEHIRELLPAFVLGALDADEVFLVEQHLRTSKEVRAEVAELRTVAGLLSYAPEQQQLPAHVKRQLFARIGATAELSFPQTVHTNYKSHTPPSFNYFASWGRGVFAMVVVALLVLMGTNVYAYSLLHSTNRQFAQLTADYQTVNDQLNATRVELQTVTDETEQLRQQMTTLVDIQRAQQQDFAFLASSATEGHLLTSEITGVEGKMYAQPGHNRVVLVLHGLQQLESGATYQFWFATADEGQIPSTTFNVEQHGIIELSIEAPEPIDVYQEVMVTVEADGGAQTPSNDVVLTASI
ncbi:MAG: Transmembrane transcriptional regulator (anti-sigma factor RsiW) [Chloroflexi bacterium AL-W]|nr:Transmembrane transcriptional regulator (anti-sigma factor RsiW) [Chloroflexi bacterium AL-N1]NOK69178.1 Transmembrane transcriptional regulator (anti-sigma factor RsiW) [Chloroflexi bacterium AL-N10]NOK77161.1 Transmembrane transcriptional regulator (anti-sigma factor RsiW) [Chloroflexi bacterium AL-N5]NOK83806.1 Transmembrane transcriptional regulator (anti-sigma factor RsiW) [Chloroflexi bacterium AL-W]NOK91016.1 Transmembrane transcriptional regulator (anti-sigma factor RsiW) [Chloroflex